MKKRIFFGLLVFALVLFALTYIPRPIMNLSPSEVSKISVLDGETGYIAEITDKDDIRRIVQNLNGVTFQKGKSSAGYMGYKFATTIYDENGKVFEELIINSVDTIRYKGFFYTAKENLIDYEYIDGKFEN